MKKLLAIFVTIVIASTLVCAFCGCEAEADYTIDVLQYGNFPALNDACNGFKDTLNAWAEQNGKTIKFNEHNANAESSNVSAIVKDAISNSPNYIFAIATPCAVSVAGAEKSTPIFYTAVTDPSDSSSNLTTCSNVFGTSDMQPIAKQIQLAKLLVPTLDKIAFLFSSNETNSRKQVDIAKAECDRLGISYEEKSITDVKDIKTVVESISEDTDAIYVPTDNTIANAMATVTTANTRNLPIICGEEGQLENGGWATLSVNYYNLGVQTAQMVIEHITNGTVANAHQTFSGEPELAFSDSAKTTLGLTDEKINQIKTALGE